MSLSFSLLKSHILIILSEDLNKKKKIRLQRQQEGVI